MTNELIFLLFHTLVKAQVIASGAVILVLLVRVPARRWLGSGLAYRLWGLPLAALVASLFPTLSEFMQGPLRPDEPSITELATATLILSIWGAGITVSLAGLAVSELQFRQKIRVGCAGPAVAGLGWHTLITPKDFRTRFTAIERDFILRHERMHIARHDPLANVIMAVMQAGSWFNPLAYIAGGYARLDQELACDEAVISHRPETRRGYAETLLKAQLSTSSSPFACAFKATFFGTGRHPMELRLQMLGRPQLGLCRHLAGASGVAALGVLLSIAIWASAPQAVPKSHQAFGEFPSAFPLFQSP